MGKKSVDITIEGATTNVVFVRDSKAPETRKSDFNLDFNLDFGTTLLEQTRNIIQQWQTSHT